MFIRSHLRALFFPYTTLFRSSRHPFFVPLGQHLKSCMFIILSCDPCNCHDMGDLPAENDSEQDPHAVLKQSTRRCCPAAHNWKCSRYGTYKDIERGDAFEGCVDQQIDEGGRRSA